MRRHLILLPLAALLVVTPLLLHGPSCGHDYNFHMQSWLDAAAQLRHAVLLPRWMFAVAWNAGEPRFIFYPPLSWMLGETLTMLLPITWVATAYIWVALTLASFTMFRLARHFASPAAALLASCLYIANPYLLFCAFERAAYAELLAAAWFPLLLLAVLRRKPTIAGVALPLALLWLTNAPAAIMGCYTMAFVFGVRLLLSLRKRRTPALPPFHIVAAAVGGMLLSVGLVAFYLLPAAYERRFVQVSMALSASYAPEQSFLFHHGPDIGHDYVLHTASLIAVGMLCAMAVLLLSWAVQTRFRSRSALPSALQKTAQPELLLILSAASVVIAFLLVRPSLFFWTHLPELVYLQFPWRFLSVLGVMAALALAIIVGRSSLRMRWLVTGATIVFAGCIVNSIHYFRLPCDDTDAPAARLTLFTEHHTPAPTDEYTPTNADNDTLRPDDPPFWLTDDASEPAPDTTPNPNETSANYDDDIEVPEDAQLSATPLHFNVNAPTAEFLIINLRNFPHWSVTRDGSAALPITPRDDGLIAIEVPAGASHIDITWHRSWDDSAGDVFSALALVIFLLLAVQQRSERGTQRPPPVT